MYLTQRTVLFLFSLCLFFLPVLTQNCSYNANLFPLSVPALSNDDDSQTYCGSPLHLSLYDIPGGSCLQLEPARGVTVGQLAYIIMTLPNNSANATLNNSTTLYATANGVNITSKVSLSSYTPGSATVCSNRPTCDSFDVYNPTSQARLQPNQIAVCLACQRSSYNYAPVQVCFSGVTSASLVGTTVSAALNRITGYCQSSTIVSGTIPSSCTDASASNCLPLEGVVVCDQQCEGKLPLSVRTAPSGPNTVCIGVFPTTGVSIKDVKYMSFVGKSNPLLNSALSITSARDAYGVDITKDVWMEVFTGGRACGNDQCLGYQVNLGLHDEMHIGDINVCLGCGHGGSDDDDVSPSWGVKAPLEVCFSSNGLQEEDFANAIIKIRAADVHGFCGIKCVKTVAVLQCAGPAPELPEDDCEDEHPSHNNHDDDNSWSDADNYGSGNDDEDIPVVIISPPSPSSKSPKRVYKKEIIKTFFFGGKASNYDDEDDDDYYDDDDDYGDDDDDYYYDDDDNYYDDDDDYGDDDDDDYYSNDDDDYGDDDDYYYGDDDDEDYADDDDDEEDCDDEDDGYGYDDDDNYGDDDNDNDDDAPSPPPKKQKRDVSSPSPAKTQKRGVSSSSPSKTQKRGVSSAPAKTQKRGVSSAPVKTQKRGVSKTKK